LSREPGVLAIEGQRIVPVRFRAGHRTYLTSVVGLPDRSELRRPHDTALRPIEVSTEGIMLTRRLAERLDVKAGDTITVEVMEGRRRKRDLPVSAVVDEMIGMGSYMPIRRSITSRVKAMWSRPPPYTRSPPRSRFCRSDSRTCR
jgi:putative ABC transport system permease protein